MLRSGITKADGGASVDAFLDLIRDLHAGTRLIASIPPSIAMEWDLPESGPASSGPIENS